MRNYEIVFLVHPDQSDQTSSIISKLDKLVNDSGGNVHRSENIGNRKLAYPIQDQFKASYGLLNVECNQETINEIKNSFKFSANKKSAHAPGSAPGNADVVVIPSGKSTRTDMRAIVPEVQLIRIKA